MKPMSSNMLRTHCRNTQQEEISLHFLLDLFILYIFYPFLPHQGCSVVRKGAGRVRELSVARVDLPHWLDAGHQQLGHLFLGNLEQMSMGWNWVQITTVVVNTQPGTDLGLPSCGTSSFHWPGGTWTEPRGLSCKAKTRRGENTNNYRIIQQIYPFYYFCFDQILQHNVVKETFILVIMADDLLIVITKIIH